MTSYNSRPNHQERCQGEHDTIVKTTSGSGYCVACRTKPCARCKKVFTSNKYVRGPSKCGECRVIIKKRESFADMEGM